MSNKIHTALESIARRDVSDDTNLWPQIAARIEQKDKVMHPKFKLAWTVVLTLLALALATTAAYAVYRYFSDPGMKSVGEAGMIQDVNATAQPTVIPGTTPGPMTLSGAQQTLEGVTVTLDWVFAQSFDQAFHISASGLEPDMRFGIATATYSGGPDENQNSGTIFTSNIEGNQTTGIYMVRQMMGRETLDVVLDVPIIKKETLIATFHFEIKNVPVYRSAGRDNSVYAFETGNATLILKWLNMTPEYTIAHLCREGDKDWSVGKASIQYGETEDRANASEVNAVDLGRAIAEGNGSCIEIGFPLKNSANIRWLVLLVDDLTIAPDKKHNGPWHFEEDVPSLGWLSSQLRIPDLPTPSTSGPQATIIPVSTPVSQTEGAYTVTLLSAYADANRVVFSVHLDGFENYSFPFSSDYDLTLTDPEASAMLNIPHTNGGADPDSHILNIQISPFTLLKSERLAGKLNLRFQENVMMDSPVQEFHFDFDLPVYKATVLTSKQKIDANGIPIWLERVEISPSYTKIDLCYAKPTTGHWSALQAMLKAGATNEVSPDGTVMVVLLDTDTDPSLIDPLEPGEIIRKDHQIERPEDVAHARCEQLGFPIGSQDQPESLTLTIPELNFFPDDISDADLKTAQDKLKPQGMEFTFEVESVQGNGFGGGGRIFNVQKKPAGMTDDDVFRAFYDALGYYHTGPWVFTINTQPGAAVTATPAPLTSQRNNNQTATLLSAYADANRVVFNMQLQGFENYSLQKGFYYDHDLADVADQAGIPLSISWVNDSLDPEKHILTLQFSPVTAMKAERLTGKLNLIVQEDMFSNSPIQAFHFNFDLPVYKATLLTINQNVTVNGLEMRIEKAEISPSYTKIDLCYAKPDARDWYISNASLQAGSNQTDADNLSNAPIMLDTDHIPDPDNLADDFTYGAGETIRKEHQTIGLPGTKHFRCIQIGFPIGSQDQPETLTLTVPELSFFPDDISDADLKTAQDKLKPQGMEFTYDVESTHGNGFGGGGRIFNVHKKPAGMSDDDVFRAFFDALGYYRTGPWVFTVPLKP